MILQNIMKKNENMIIGDFIKEYTQNHNISSKYSFLYKNKVLNHPLIIKKSLKDIIIDYSRIKFYENMEINYVEEVNTEYSENIDAQNKRGNIGDVYYFMIKGSDRGSVWGDSIYSDDSNIAKAAVLEGRCKLGEVKKVGIKMLPGRSSYSSANKNGISSSSWGSWDGSYIFVD